MQENSNSDVVETPVEETDDLNNFSETFFGTAKPEDTEEGEEGEEVTEQEDTPAPEDQDEDETEGDDEEVDNPEEDESKFKLGKPKLTAKERVEQLNAKYREEERARLAAEAELRELKERQAKEVKEPVKEAPASVGPTPDDKDENGEDKYPLGEYDPEYIRDLHRFERDEMRKEIAKEFQQQQENAARDAAVTALQSEWSGKVEAAEERLPDLRERGLQLEQALAGADPAVIESLAMTIMTLENGPDVLYYLSENVEEARAIARGGPNALIALGRLDGYVKPSKTEVKLVSNAPEPPPSRTRGTGGRFTVAPDTEDLDAFSDMFFKKK